MISNPKKLLSLSLYFVIIIISLMPISGFGTEENLNAKNRQDIDVISNLIGTKLSSVVCPKDTQEVLGERKPSFAHYIKGVKCKTADNTETIQIFATPKGVIVDASTIFSKKFICDRNLLTENLATRLFLKNAIESKVQNSIEFKRKEALIPKSIRNKVDITPTVNCEGNEFFIRAESTVGSLSYPCSSCQNILIPLWRWGHSVLGIYFLKAKKNGSSIDEDKFVKMFQDDVKNAFDKEQTKKILEILSQTDPVGKEIFEELIAVNTDTNIARLFIKEYIKESNQK